MRPFERCAPLGSQNLRLAFLLLADFSSHATRTQGVEKSITFHPLEPFCNNFTEKYCLKVSFLIENIIGINTLLNNLLRCGVL
jgi:hypothetical protein